MQESDLPAKNDDVVCLTHRSARFAGKPRSNRSPPLERGLPAIRLDAIGLIFASTSIAGKHRSHIGNQIPVGARLAREER